MEVQKFRVSEDTEAKILAVGDIAATKTEIDLDEMHADCYLGVPFLLYMYDAGRFPFSAKINREAFPDFIQEAYTRFPFFGTFDCYLFILQKIFGPLTEIFFDVPAAGKLTIEVNAVSDLEFEFVARELVDGSYVFYEITDHLGDQLVFRGISGIENLSQLNLLFSEIMPAGIFPDISLTFFSRSDFIGEDTDGEFNVVTYIEDQIVFVEVGG
jgi:hypothetical protein